jgi:hypothetical protein
MYILVMESFMNILKLKSGSHLTQPNILGFSIAETPQSGGESLYQQTDSYKISRENLLRDFLNAETPYERYVLFNRALSWLDSKDETAHYREQEIIRLQSTITGYDLSEYET